ncbi:acetate--CoA ligase family protein [Octadecabacter antarcticus]|uniref:acetate--CoA ligase family protein n=1 Tax=Octadecabacter antarcticus TaxID=1217908 RepID=UPI0005C60B97|nr:acetate--CoA ligase family protein [Octadecabacter antarcticus]
MTHNLSRLLRPKSVAVIGGGAWCRAVIEQLQKLKFSGDIWPIHPSAREICGLPTHPSVHDLPDIPDAAFIGINRDATIEVVAQLSKISVGGAICFASGFSETDGGQNANARLLKAAANMPILGPNCYGMINALDGASLWPDQHGCLPVDRGLAILTQSSNIAINLTMQQRGLPIAYVVTCGNQAQLSMAQIADALLDDPRVTAIGLHIEGFSDLVAWQALARKAYAKGIPLVALKVGKSIEAQSATISHTASLAGSDAGATALLQHLGIARVDDLPTLLETLKILHVAGPLPSGQIASISCSGGEASLIADMAYDTALTFPPLTDLQEKRLLAALGPKVALANPLDYHTYVWRDIGAMTRTFSAMIVTEIAITFLIVDFPRGDICDPSDWECAIQSALDTRAATGGTIAMVATLTELMPEHVARRLMTGGIIPMGGIREALAATQAAHQRAPRSADLVVATASMPAETLSEADAKRALEKVGVMVPKLRTGDLETLATHADIEQGPFVLKSIGAAHKSEAGGVALSLTSGDAVRNAGAKMSTKDFILEEMITDSVAEILVGIVKDPAHGFVITIGAGGINAELMQDTASVLMPASRECLKQTLNTLKVAKILNGYRNQPTGDINAMLDAIDAIQSYVLANLDTIEEVEVNPLIITQTRAVAADALIRKRHD